MSLGTGFSRSRLSNVGFERLFEHYENAKCLRRLSGGKGPKKGEPSWI